MKKDVAQALIDSAMAFGSNINEMSALLGGIPEEREREHYRKCLGDVMEIVYRDIMRPIIREYPDLDPDKPD